MRILFALCLCIGFLACKQGPKNEPAPVEPDTQSIPEKIAQAHGIAHWSAVERLDFVFNFKQDTLHFKRSWAWMPKSNEVMAMGQDTVSYMRNAVDSVLARTDAGFINDKYWLLAPFQLVWDKNSFTYEVAAAQTAPLSGQTLDKLTIVYGNEGGYTPGDAYDFFYDSDFIIREWVFRRANQEEPSSISSWEGYQDFSGLKISTTHNYEVEGQQLFFTGVAVTSSATKPESNQ